MAKDQAAAFVYGGIAAVLLLCLFDAENVARKAKRGLWSNSLPIAPWDFRAQSKKK